MKLISQSYTDRGSRPGVNQDAVVEINNSELSVFCVADGMGGHQNGEKASGAIAEYISRWHDDEIRNRAHHTFPETIDSFETAISEANSYIYKEYNNGSICGSTIVAMIVMEDLFALFSAGDSRIYRKHGFSMHRMTTDDVWENDPDHIKGLTKEQVKLSPNHGVLTKAVGTDEHLVMSSSTGRIKKGDVFFLCCDGVYKSISEKQLRRSITKPEQIIKAVKNSGAKDNYSFITIKVM